jgi:hypothetical protein
VKKIVATPGAKGLDVVYQATKTARYYWSLQVLWPNITQIMWRMWDYVGDEIRPAPEDPPLIQTILTQVKVQTSAIEESGILRSYGLDRDVLVHFLRHLLREVSRVYFIEVRASAMAWDSTQIGFNLWRQSAPGELEIKVVAEFDPQGISETLLHQVATHILSPLDWEILAEDEARLWSADGAPQTDKQDEDDNDDTDKPPLYLN